MTMPSRSDRFQHIALRRSLGQAALAFLCLAGMGCGREFYRNWADQDVTEAVFEKSRDPRWRIDLFTIEPPSMSRFADPYDPDRPPAPPDDRAAEALSPVPQWPHHRLLTPAEGTGYMEMMEAWQRQRDVQVAMDEAAERQKEGEEQDEKSDAGPPDVPPSSQPSPFNRQPSPPPVDLDATGTDTPTALRSLLLNDHAMRLAVARGEAATPITSRPRQISSAATRLDPAPVTTAAAPQPRPTSPQSPTSAPRDPSLSRAAVQTPSPAPAAQPRDTSRTVVPVQEDEDGIQTLPPPGDLSSESILPPRVPLDPDPIDVDLATPDALDRPRGGSTAPTGEGVSGLLAPARLPFDETEAAALPDGSKPYVITPTQAMTLALINSRAYQFQIEQLYLDALAVTLQRWNFEPQFIAGMSPLTGPRAGTPGPNFANSYLYRTFEAPGGQASVLSIGTLAGVGKVLAFGGNLVAGFANEVVFDFSGSNPIQPSVNSVLPLSFVQPLLRGGGRAVTMEPLTLAERNLLYSVREFARFRQSFFPSVLTSGEALILAGGGGGDASIGFLQVIQQIQVVQNNQKIVAAYEQLLRGYNEMAKGGGSGVSQLNVQEVDTNLQSQRQNLIQASTRYRILLDQYKTQLGIPPDVPVVLDREITGPFRDVFQDIDDWFTREDRDPVDLPRFVDSLPELPDIDLDGRRVIEDGANANLQEEVLLIAERIALENRYELMNARAQLYDQWRQLAVTANGLKGIFNMVVTNQVFTSSTSDNPFAFIDQAKQFNLRINAELPLIRLNERNLYRTSEINYRRQQRALMQLEDSTKLQVRNEIRNLIQTAEFYEIQKRQLVVNLLRRDNSQRQIFAPPGPGEGGASQVTATTNQLIQSLNQSLSALNGLIGTWVSYQTGRIALYRDLGIIPYDEWEAYNELFPAESSTRASSDPGRGE